MRDKSSSNSNPPLDVEALWNRIDALETEGADRNRADAALQSLVTATGAVGGAFFPALVRHLSEGLGLRHVFVTRCAGESRAELQTLAIWNTDRLADNAVYPIAGTPCEIVARRGEFFCAEGVQKMFPEHNALAILEAESYLGIRIDDANGTTLGHLCVLDDKPIPHPDRPMSIMRMFCGRIAAELERIRTEEERVILTRELDHRVKNMLSVVSSIAEHTVGNSTSLDVFREAFLGRLGSLAIAHDMLAHQNWAGAKVGELVQRIIQPHNPPSAKRFQCRGPEVMLPAAVAAPLCIVLHELLTNAIKYGALSVAGGTVAIAWDTTSDEQCATAFVVTWTENGGPAVSADSPTGYGSELIRELIPYQLNGGVELRFAESGVQCTIRIPLPASTTTTAGAESE